MQVHCELGHGQLFSRLIVCVCRQERIDDAVEAWEHLVAARSPSQSDIDAIAQAHLLTQGKWMVFPRSATEADAAWAAVSRLAVAAGWAAKVSTVSPGGQGGSGHVMCVYARDYLNKEGVFEVAQQLKRHLPPLQDRCIRFKPDILTYLSIYKGNEYRIKPTVYDFML
jgi:hypothetical protein